MKFIRLSLLILILNSFLCGQCVNLSVSGFSIEYAYDTMGSTVDQLGITIRGVDNGTATGAWDSSIDLSGMSSGGEIILYGSLNNGSAPSSLFSVVLYDSSFNTFSTNSASLSDLASQGYVTFTVPPNSFDWSSVQYIDINFGGLGYAIDVTFTMLCAYGEENDSDGDGTPDEEDAFPNDPNEWIDTDGDTIGNNADTDDDNDTYLDAADAFPLDASEWLDTDGDTIGDNADTDDDNDGITDSYDPFPLVYDVSSNVPSSLSGYVEIYFSDNYPSYGIWYATGENTSIEIWNDGSSETRYQDAYSWDSQNLTSTGSLYYDSTFRVNFKDKTNDLFFRFTYVSESNDPSFNDSGKGFFYDGRIDLDKNGMADGEQITNGLTFPATDSIIDLLNIHNSAESNLIPIQVLDYATNEKLSLNEVNDLRPGSTMIEVSENQATVQLQMEESSDLQTWEDIGTPATMIIPADTDTKFFRFKMAE